MQIHRLLEMVYLLLNNKRLTARELAQRFEVSERTIYRDVEALCAAGIPIYTDRGKGGGIRILQDFVLDKSLLSAQEQDELLFSLQSFCVAREPQAQALMDRLRSIFQRKEPQWIEADFSPWGSNKQQQEAFGLMKTAIIQHRRLSFQYYGAQGRPTRREVEPARLVFKGRAWYLQGFCLLRSGWRAFRVTRITNLKLCPQIFQPHPVPPELDMKTASSPAGGQQPCEVRLRISPAMNYRVFDEFPPESIQTDAQGYSTVSMNVPEDEWIYGFILSFGDAVQVLGPPHIRQEIQWRVERMRRNYLDLEKPEPEAERMP